MPKVNTPLPKPRNWGGPREGSGPKVKIPDRKVTTVSLASEHVAALDAEIGKTGENRSAVLRRILTDWIARWRAGGTWGDST